MANNSIEYDPNIIQEFAKRLYRQASTIVAAYVIGGILVGAIIGSILVALPRGANIAPGVGLLFGGIFGGIFGYIRGAEKAFKLKLEAQLALCQVQIESNTRSTPEHAA